MVPVWNPRERGSWCELVVLTINERAHICGLSGYQEPRLLCVSFMSPYRLVGVLLRLLTSCFYWCLSLHRPIMIGGAGGSLKPRPKSRHPRYDMLSQSLHSLASCGRTRH